MKKLLCLFLTMLIFAISVLPASAANNDSSSLKGYELSVKRLVGKITNTSKLEVAEDILYSLDMSSDFVARLSNERKIEIYNSNEIFSNVEYCSVDKYGNEKAITKFEYEQQKNGNGENISHLSSNDNIYENELEDSSLKKTILCYEKGDAARGTYVTLISYTWKKMPTFRGKDILVFSSENLIVSDETFNASCFYDKKVTYRGKTTVTTEGVNDDYNSVAKESRFGSGRYCFGYIFPLPADTVSQNPANYDIRYSNFAVYFCIEARVQNPGSETVFKTYGSYYHQTISLEPSITVGKDGLSFSVSPKVAYPFSAKTISLRNSITYIP